MCALYWLCMETTAVEFVICLHKRCHSCCLAGICKAWCCHYCAQHFLNASWHRWAKLFNFWKCHLVCIASLTVHIIECGYIFLKNCAGSPARKAWKNAGLIEHKIVLVVNDTFFFLSVGLFQNMWAENFSLYKPWWRACRISLSSPCDDWTFPASLFQAAPLLLRLWKGEMEVRRRPWKARNATGKGQTKKVERRRNSWVSL